MDRGGPFTTVRVRPCARIRASAASTTRSPVESRNRSDRRSASRSDGVVALDREQGLFELWRRRDVEVAARAHPSHVARDLRVERVGGHGPRSGGGSIVISGCSRALITGSSMSSMATAGYRPSGLSKPLAPMMRSGTPRVDAAASLQGTVKRALPRPCSVLDHSMSGTSASSSVRAGPPDRRRGGGDSVTDDDDPCRVDQERHRDPVPVGPGADLVDANLRSSMRSSSPDADESALVTKTRIVESETEVPGTSSAARRLPEASRRRSRGEVVEGGLHRGTTASSPVSEMTLGGDPWTPTRQVSPVRGRVEVRDQHSQAAGIHEGNLGEVDSEAGWTSDQRRLKGRRSADDTRGRARHDP